MAQALGQEDVFQTFSLYGFLHLAGVQLTRVWVWLSSTLSIKHFLKLHILKIYLLKWFSKFVVVQPSFESGQRSQASLPTPTSFMSHLVPSLHIGGTNPSLPSPTFSASTPRSDTPFLKWMQTFRCKKKVKKKEKYFQL